MELFSEIYSRYYLIAEQLLIASQQGITEKEMSQIISEYGFSESNLFLLPKFTSEEYHLFEKINNIYYSKITHPKGYPLSNLQRSFLKSILLDKRIRLFLSSEELAQLDSLLKDSKPLFDWNDFYYFDRLTQGDCYDDPVYQSFFRTIITAIKEHQTLHITFESKHKNLISENFAPYRIQYSSKDDCFWLLCVLIHNGKLIHSSIIKLSRIQTITNSTEKYPQEKILFEYFHKQYVKEPVVIEISEERNALERCMLHFANYEKQTERIKNTNRYLCRIYYNKREETELLIRILSFGPVISVLGPESFLSLVKKRIAKQSELMKQNNNFVQQ